MATIARVKPAAYTIPTDAPESDGTLAWDRTTLVLVEIEAGDETGIGYSYAHAAAARLIAETLCEVVAGADPTAINALWWKMQEAVRNFGRPGIAASAISAVDNALWDLKAKLLGVPLVILLGQVHESVPVYGSGGFTSYSPDELTEQLGAWAQQGFGAVKMKVGRVPEQDAERVRAARGAIGPEVELFVDANGAYSRKQALFQAEQFAESRVTWFEEPVSADDRCGLRLLRDRAPAGMEISAGEYGYTISDFRQLLEEGAVDVLQADATRCLGISGFLRAAALCEAFHLPLSTHTAPAVHLSAACACHSVRHVEWFHDHVLIEKRLFDGASEPRQGRLQPDLSRPGLGLEFRHVDAEPYAI